MGMFKLLMKITERMLKIESIESIGLIATGIVYGFNNMLRNNFSAELLKTHLH